MNDRQNTPPSHNLLVELLVEELPPKALKKLGEAFGALLLQSLQGAGLAGPASALQGFATPRRLAAHISQVLAQAPQRAQSVKLMPVAVGLGADGNPTPALLKKLAALGLDATAVAGLRQAPDGKAQALFVDTAVAGASLAQGLQQALDHALAKLPIPKVMQYQLESGPGADFQPGWTSVNFVRPAHGLVALHGADVVSVRALGLEAGRQTQGHRFEAPVSPLVLTHADRYETQLAQEGAVVARFDTRRADIVQQLARAAAQQGLRPIDDDALLDEVTALVERPQVMTCSFEPDFLAVPPECLVLTMKANQKYFPLLDAQGELTNQFLIVSNISPADASRVIQGNERVVRPRLADAKFFFDQDRKKTLASRVVQLDKVVYHGKLGSQGQRVERVRALARNIGQQLGGLGGPDLAQHADRAALLAKADLLTDMVGEFPELQGVMGGYYARHDAEPEAVALAIEDHYKPRFAGDALARGDVGLVVALADKLETLAGLFAIGEKPSGDKDPFALRRHALGVIRMLTERDLPLHVQPLVNLALAQFVDVPTQACEELTQFIYDRLVGQLRDQGHSAQAVDAVIALRPPRLGDVARRLAAVRAFAELPESAALASANKRVSNILKKVEGGLAQNVNAAHLKETAELNLANALQRAAGVADAAFAQGDYTASLTALAGLKEPVDAFFEHVMVNAEDATLRRNRLALLAQLHRAMNRVADLSRLAV